MSVELDKLRQLPVADKLHIVEQLWDDIGSADEALLLRDWHLAEARRRAAELEADPQRAITRDELWRRVDHADG